MTLYSFFTAIARSQWSPVLYTAIVLMVIGYTILSRSYGLGSIPVGLYWDEMAMLVDVKAILATGRDMHGQPWWQTLFVSYGDYKLPVYIWLASMSSALFGVSEWAIRFPSMIAGLGTVILSGLSSITLLKTLAPTSTSSQQRLLFFFTVTVVSVAPWSMMFSRTGFEGHVGQFLLALSIYMILMARHKTWILILATVIGIISVYTYFSIRFVWPVVFGMMILMPMIIKQKSSNAKLAYTHKYTMIFTTFAKTILCYLIFFIGLVPMISNPYYSASNQFRLSTHSVLETHNQVLTANTYREIAGNTVADRIFFHRWLLTLKELASNYSDHLSLQTLFISGDSNLRHGTTLHGLFLAPFLPFFLIGWWYWWKQHKAGGIILAAWWLITLLPASIPEETPHALRSLNGIVPLSIVIGGGLTHAYVFARQHLSQKWHGITSIACASVIVLSVWHYTYTYFVTYPIYSARDWQGGYKELAQGAYSFRKNNEKIVILPFDDRFYLWMMAYGPYSGKEFATWESHNFQFHSFDGVVTQSQDIDKALKDLLYPTIIIGRADDITKTAATYSLKPEYIHSVYSATAEYQVWYIAGTL